MMLALLLLVFVDVAAFWLPVYRPLLAPLSTTGFFEKTLRAADLAAKHPATDVLVIGDSRTFQGLATQIADRTSGGYHFINASVSGSTPRVWETLVRTLDPHANRFRAVVVPVDTYADDDGSLGSVDNDNHYADLHYIALHTSVADIPHLAGSFGPVDQKVSAFLDLALRGPLVREDVQSLVSDPLERFSELREPPPVLGAINATNTTLGGLVADFTTQTLTLREPMDSEELGRLRRQIFHVPVPSEAYAAYRREWLGPIVERYRRAGVPVIFVRIPARPLTQIPPAPPSGTVVVFAKRYGAQLVPQDAYVALEHPRFFSDAEHLNIYGAALFSQLVGRDVGAAIRNPHLSALDAAAPPPPPVAPAIARTPEPFVTEKPDAKRVAATVSVATPAPTAPPAGNPLEERLRAIGAAMMIGRPIPLLSYEFAFFFLAVVALVALLPNEPLRRGIMLVASWYFYARWNAGYLVVLLALTTLDYFVARGVERATGARKRTLLIAGVCANLAFLGFAKYVDFFSGSIAALTGRPPDVWALHLLVPVGISFHTFQSISYVVDVARGNAPNATTGITRSTSRSFRNCSRGRSYARAASSPNSTRAGSRRASARRAASPRSRSAY